MLSLLKNPRSDDGSNAVVEAVGTIIKDLSDKNDNFTSLNQISSDQNSNIESLKVEPRWPPPTTRPVSVSNFRRTSPTG